MFKMKKNNIINLVGIAVIIGVLSFFVFRILNVDSPSGNVISEGTLEFDDIKNSCECVERNNLKCSLDGFKVDEKRMLCVHADGRVTNAVLGCSKYNCNETIYEVKKYG